MLTQNIRDPSSDRKKKYGDWETSVGRRKRFPLLHKWASKGTLLCCEVRFRSVVARLIGRLSEASNDKIRFVSDSQDSEVVIEFSAVSFSWAESTIGGNNPAIVIEFGREAQFGRCDSVTFSEVKL